MILSPADHCSDSVEIDVETRFLSDVDKVSVSPRPWSCGVQRPGHEMRVRVIKTLCGRKTPCRAKKRETVEVLCATLSSLKHP